MLIESVKIGNCGYTPFSFDCAMAAYDGGINMKFAVFLRPDNSVCNFFRNNATFFDWCNYFMFKCNFFR